LFAVPTGTGTPFGPGLTGLGPLTPGSAATLRWNGTSFVNINNSSIVAGSGTSGTANEFDPYNIAEFSPAQQRNGATMTIDQRLTRDITFVGEAFYSNRRSHGSARRTLAVRQ